MSRKVLQVRRPKNMASKRALVIIVRPIEIANDLLDTLELTLSLAVLPSKLVEYLNLKSSENRRDFVGAKRIIVV